jgi:hypothetical protein
LVTDNSTPEEIRAFLARREAEFQAQKKLAEVGWAKIMKTRDEMEALWKEERNEVKKGLYALNVIVLGSSVFAMKSDWENEEHIINIGAIAIENTLSLKELASKIPDSDKIMGELTQRIEVQFQGLSDAIDDTLASLKARQEQIKPNPEGMYE